MYVGGGIHELLNGKVKLHIDEIKELINELYYYEIIEDITKDVKTQYERKIETLKKRHKTELKTLKTKLKEMAL